MSAKYVREYYKVKAKRGQRVSVDGRPGVITSFPGQYIKVRFDGDRHSIPCHPTWRVDYEYNPPKTIAVPESTVRTLLILLEESTSTSMHMDRRLAYIDAKRSALAALQKAVTP